MAHLACHHRHLPVCEVLSLLEIIPSLCLPSLCWPAYLYLLYTINDRISLTRRMFPKLTKVVYRVSIWTQNSCTLHQWGSSLVRLYRAYVYVNVSSRLTCTSILKLLTKLKKDFCSLDPYQATTSYNIVPDLMKKAGFSGFYTNHSEPATTATRLHHSTIDGQLIKSRTGHSGVWVYVYGSVKEFSSLILYYVIARVFMSRFYLKPHITTCNN